MRNIAAGLPLLSTITTALLFFSFPVPARAAPEGEPIERYSAGGQLRFLGSPLGSPLGYFRGDGTRTPAEQILQSYAPLFGITDPARELRLMKREDRPSGRAMARYQQLYQGLPVIGGELILNTAGTALLSVNGEVATGLNLPTLPQVPAEQARDTALAAVAKWHRLPPALLTATEPELSVYDPRLLGPETLPASLVWRIQVEARDLRPLRELVLVDARTGGIRLHFNQAPTARNRLTYNAGNTVSDNLPGGVNTTPVCTESDGDPCTGGSDTEVDNAHQYAADTYDFFLNTHGRDSLDNAGYSLISTVRFCPSGFDCPTTTPFINAFWNGSQVAYGDGFASADDVVAHEFTHGFTQFTSNLFYFYQSGAISESFSDLWGEFVDQTNSRGTDGAGVDWQLGEDLPASVGVIRNMADPTLFGDPDFMTSTNYDLDPAFVNNGGVHSNSGINNKAVYLMTAGDTFNGVTVTGIGLAKTAAVYYEAQTSLLTAAADYADLYNALSQACQNLLIGGTAGIVAGDCTEVQNALNAVEMNQDPVADFQPQAALCAGGQAPASLLFDDFESGLGNWSSVRLLGRRNAWGLLDASNGGPYAVSGARSAFINDVATISDTVLRLNTDYFVPPAPALYLHFAHAFQFENNSGTFYDGSVLEYSTDGGASWNDASGLWDSGKNYGGILSAGSGNPLAGRNAFVGASNGYVSSRYDLSSLAGSRVRFRFRQGTDSGTAGVGWFLDDVRLYSCTAVGNSPPTANAGPDQSVTAGTTNLSLDGSASTDSDGALSSYYWTQIAGTPVTLSSTTAVSPSFDAPSGSSNLSFRLTVVDDAGGIASDTVNVNVRALTVRSGGGGGGCFIATAAFGSYVEPEVLWLRRFRDEFLLKQWNLPGKMFVDLYYEYSPAAAAVLARHSWIRAVVRLGLTPIVALSRLWGDGNDRISYLAGNPESPQTVDPGL